MAPPCPLAPSALLPVKVLLLTVTVALSGTLSPVSSAPKTYRAPPWLAVAPLTVLLSKVTSVRVRLILPFCAPRSSSAGLSEFAVSPFTYRPPP